MLAKQDFHNSPDDGDSFFPAEIDKGHVHKHFRNAFYSVRLDQRFNVVPAFL